jgi:Zn-dependent protease with chaperone function
MKVSLNVIPIKKIDAPIFHSVLKELANLLHIPVPDVMLFEVLKGNDKYVDAYMINPNLMLIHKDYIRYLRDTEIKHIIAHELSHSAQETTMQAYAILQNLISVLPPELKKNLGWIYFFLRAIERNADEGAIKITKNPKAFLTLRYKEKINMPHEFTLNDNHPSYDESIGYAYSLIKKEGQK